ncbi:Clp protease ClpP [Candidatus Palauibacter sp.]|uniref:Clp protease ClpP n=1 Tax=Candidatus Palauibacter sp. TaxID=3101350 RepID=UPI003CC6138C
MKPKTDIRSLLAERAAHYRAVQAHAGVSLRCLDPEAEDAPETATVEADGDRVVVRVQGPLDDWWGFDVRALIDELNEADPKAVHLLIESPGGFLDDGLALYADLRARARDGVEITAEARGVVASAAVLPFLAAREREMTTGTLLMVHDPWTRVFMAGTADEIEGGVDRVLNGLRAGEKTLRQVLAGRTGKSRQQVTAWLGDETWFTPDEALDAGFATAVAADDDAAEDEGQDDEARALARRVLAGWRLRRMREVA